MIVIASVVFERCFRQVCKSLLPEHRSLYHFVGVGSALNPELIVVAKRPGMGEVEHRGAYDLRLFFGALSGDVIELNFQERTQGSPYPQDRLLQGDH